MGPLQYYPENGVLLSAVGADILRWAEDEWPVGTFESFDSLTVGFSE